MAGMAAALELAIAIAIATHAKKTQGEEEK